MAAMSGAGGAAGSAQHSSCLVVGGGRLLAPCIRSTLVAAHGSTAQEQPYSIASRGAVDSVCGKEYMPGELAPLLGLSFPATGPVPMILSLA